MSWIESSKLISRLRLYKKLDTPYRKNIVPFIFLYVAALYYVFNHFSWDFGHNLNTTNSSNLNISNATNTTTNTTTTVSTQTYHQVLSVLILPLVALLHILSFLFTYWSVDVDALVNFTEVTSLDKATHVKVDPSSHKGSKSMSPLEISKNAEIFFRYQKKSYFFDKNTTKFVKLDFPVEKQFGQYKNVVNEIHDDDWVQKLTQKYGQNIFDIPMPTFKELFIEQALAPFFVFQVFCVGLWLLDEYWYYSIFILIMLLTFEATVVKQRLANLTVLRNMMQPARPIQVLRNGKWSQVSSVELVPGDLCFVTREESEPPLPCDLLLISGSCVTNEAMLTGESTPQLKESIVFLNDSDRLSLNKHGTHVLFAGTKVVQVSADKKNREYKAPEHGSMAYVLRTGFDTSQGKLVRTILFSTTRVTANTMESLYFILFLLCFAIIASGYVLMKGLADANRSRYKLLLECTLIITSVVPPELPTELSLAVNTSLQRLQKLSIFCTEPFRIPFAGKIDVCCFDKTGTLTDEHLVLKGVAGLENSNDSTNGDDITDPEDVITINEKSSFVMGACHSLSRLDTKEIIGDPMEKATLENSGWSLGHNNELMVSRNGRLRIVHRHHFSSALARMSTIVTLEHVDGMPVMALVKGAPEVIESRLASVPAHYTSTYLHYSRQGKRVIALAYKNMKENRDQVHKVAREDVESNLVFGGFLVFECPLKPDSALGIEKLKHSSHKIIMITGDNPLTACQVAKDLSITTKPSLILEKRDGKFTWEGIGARDKKSSSKSSSDSEIIPFSDNANEVTSLAQKYDLCLYGEGVSMVLDHKYSGKILACVNVIARASPEHKTRVLATLKNYGYTTLMCGDGTNDVGALKQAHVGIALLNSVNPVNDKKDDNEKEEKTAREEDQTGLAMPKGTKAKRRAVPKATQPPPKVLRQQAIQQQRKLVEQWEAELAKSDPRLVKLGDASIASPFTAKSSSVLSVAQIIRQGRCTLVTVRQMYHILALNCLIQAYGLSVLYSDGIKMGDTQATTTGILIALCFLFIARAEPLDDLSKQRPLPNLFCPYLFVAIMGQFFVHCSSLIYVVYLANEYQTGPKPTPDSPFSANIVNTGVFLIMSSMNAANFAINYVGHPFMQSIRENRLLFNLLVVFAVVISVLALEIAPPLNEMFELVRLPWGFRWRLWFTMIGDFAVAYGIERTARALLT